MRKKRTDLRLWKIVGAFLPVALLLGLLTVSALGDLNKDEITKATETLKTNPPACKPVDDPTLVDVQKCRDFLVGVLRTKYPKSSFTPDDVQAYLIANVSYYKGVKTAKPTGPAPSNGEWKNATAPSQQLKDFVGNNCESLVGKVVGSAPGTGGALTKTWQFNNQVVYHDTDAPNKCTLFYTASPDGKSGRIVGFGFHTDIHIQSKYKLAYVDPFWKVPSNIDIDKPNPGR
jgi:hypothetical protein